VSARSSIHPFTGALYELRPDGTIAVSDGSRSGIFGPDGRWISGALRECDPQLCVWVANDPASAATADSHLTAARNRLN
jgi:hypothetical protein